MHHVALDGDLQRSHWALRPLWNDRDLWSSVIATTTPPTTFDRWLRPWARLRAGMLLAIFLLHAAAAIAAARQARAR